MTTLTPNGQLHENAADHAAAAVHALSHMSASAHRDPTGMAIGSAAMIVAHVAENGIIGTSEQLADPGLTAAQVDAITDMRDVPACDPETAAREHLTKAMLADTHIAIAHAGGMGVFRVVAIATDHAKVRQSRDGRGPLPTRTLHYETIESAGYGEVVTTADLTPATVHGHTEYRDEDRQLAQDLSSTLGNLEHVHRAASGHNLVTSPQLLAIDRAAIAIRDALHEMRLAAHDDKPKPESAGLYTTGQRVRHFQYGDGTVTIDQDNSPFVVRVQFDNGKDDAWFASVTPAVLAPIPLAFPVYRNIPAF